MPLPLKKLLWPLCLLSVASGSGETFRNPVRIPLPVDPYGVATGDLNGDGRLDIVWTEHPAYPGTPVLHVLLAGANGQYTPAPDLAPPASLTPMQCLVEDVTGDKRNDLVCVAVSGSASATYLLTYAGNGDGTFAAPVQTAVTAPVDYSNPILAGAGDLNGDGLPDVLLMNAYYSGVLPFLSKGQGGFQAAPAFEGSFNFSVPTVTDLNGDGRLDVLWPTGPRVDLGNGDGTFSGIAEYDPGYDSNCAFGDVDGDGHLDAACTWYDSGDLDGSIHLTVLHGNADGSFGKTPLFSRTFGNDDNQYDGLATLLAPVLIADLNGDGYADIVSLSGDGYCVLSGGPNTTWSGQPQQFVAASTQSQGGLPGIYGVSIADMNGDGLPDIVAIGPNGLYLTYGRADGTLSSAPATELGQVSTSATLVDVNGDGNLDAVSAGDTALKLSLGRGDGSFRPPQAITTTGNFGDANYVPGKVVSGDFNGDGKQDLLATGSVAAYTSQNYILFGHGDGTFAAPAPTGTAPGQVADLNGDGLSDVFSIQNGATTTNVLLVSLSRGDGTFTTVSTNLPAESTGNGFVQPAVGPAVGDFRHSGRLDAAIATSNNAYLLRSHGDGTFDPTGTALPIPGLPSLDKTGVSDIAAGDFDNDGNLDLAVLVTYGNGAYDQSTPTSAVWVFYGNGDGTFSSATAAGTFNRDAQALRAGDLNGDGLADLVLTSYDVYQDNGVLIVHALPNRAWGPEADYTGGEGLSPFWITDINHDGRNDLIFSNAGRSNYASDSISVLLNEAANTVTGSLSASPEPSNVTYPFTLHASLTPSNAGDVLGGSVSFSIDGTAAGSALVAGNAASLLVSNPLIAAGTHSLSATWPGNATYPPVTLTGMHAVSALPLSLALTATPSATTVGGTVTATATFTPGITPGLGYQFTGTMTLYDDGSAIAQQQVSRSGYSFALPSLAAGTHSLTASYSGDPLFSSAQSNAVTVTVAGAATVATLTAAPSPASYGAPVTLTASVSSSFQGSIGGTVTFYADGSALGSTAAVNGSAAIVTASLQSGTHALTCAYSGDSTFAASSCAPVAVTIRNDATAMTLVSSANPAPALSAVTFTANLSAQGKPFSAAIVFSIDGGAVKTVSGDAGGNAAYTTQLSAGAHTVSAQFAGTEGYDPASASIAQTVAANPTATSLPPPGGAVFQGQPFRLAATVTALTGTSSPNGTITVSEGGTVVAQASTAASAPGSISTTTGLTVASLAAGTHSLTATYTPADGNFLASASQALAVTVILQSFTLSTSAPALSIATERHGSFTASVQSLGAFAGPVQLSCTYPPKIYLSCEIASPLLQLAANGSATTQVTLDTDAVLGFKSGLGPGPAGFRAVTIALGMLLALPLALPGGRRRLGKLALLLLAFAAGATALSLTGCGDHYPGHTPPGSYDIVLTAQGASAGSPVAVTQVVHLQLTVTPE